MWDPGFNPQFWGWRRGRKHFGDRHWACSIQDLYNWICLI
jgi:hypothetical protein